MCRFIAQYSWLMYSNPVGWLFCLIIYLARSVVEALSKYATTMHVLTGKNFFTSGKQTYGVLKRHFKPGLISSVASATVLKLSAMLMTISICWLTFMVGVASFYSLILSSGSRY